MQQSVDFETTWGRHCPSTLCRTNLFFAQIAPFDHAVSLNQATKQHSKSLFLRECVATPEAMVFFRDIQPEREARLPQVFTKNQEFW